MAMVGIEVFYLVITLLALLAIRILVVIPHFQHFKRQKPSLKKLNDKSIMILLGSGGHTGEMLRLVETVDADQVGNVHWIVSSGDTTSAVRLKKFLRATTFNSSSKNDIYELKRAREVGQGLLSSVKSTLLSLGQTFNLLFSSHAKPDVLILNGPATAVPLCYVATLLNILGISNTKIIYVESLARVRGLSLSGKLCYPLAHRFLVQWETLHQLYPRSEYYGILV